MTQDADALVSSDVRRTFAARYHVALLDRTLFLAAAAALVVTALSFLARAAWVLELLTHFRLQLAVGAGVLVVLSLLRRKLASLVLAAIVATANGVFLVPYLVPGAGVAEAGGAYIRVMAANVRYGNSRYSSLREAIRHEDPDIVGLLEFTGAWMEELEALHDEYPYAIVRPEDGAFGLALFSRVPLRELPESPYVEDGTLTAIAAGLELEQKPVNLILGHLRAPTSPGKARLRNVQLREIAATVDAEGEREHVLVGDLNITPWSPYYRALEAESGLVNAARGRGYIPTWPAWLPAGFMRIPIDHCLLSGGLRARQVRSGPAFGSDHLSLIVDIALAAPVAGEI